MAHNHVFADTCEGQAHWRLSLVQRFPRDHYNEMAADELFRVAEWARALTPERTDELFAVLAHDCPDCPDGVFPGSSETLRLMSHFGTGRFTMENPEAFVREVCSQAAREYREIVLDGM